MGYPRPRPKHLANKLLQIRLTLGVSQGEMVRRLGLQNLIDPTSISKYETDKNEPPLAILLAYARAVGISTDTLIDDSLQLAFPESLTTPQEPVESSMSTVQSRMRIVVFPRQQPQKPLAEKLLQIREWLKLSQLKSLTVSVSG
jgi:transcriptional regulator with XRE-family HTH domain